MKTALTHHHFTMNFQGMFILALAILIQQNVCLESEEGLLERIFNLAKSDVEEELALGGSSNQRFHQSRENIFTKEMATRNALFRKMKEHFEKQGLTSKKSQELSKKSMDRNYKEVNYVETEGNQEYFIAAKTDLCNTNVISTTCQTSDKFRSFDGNCNNLENPLVGSAGNSFTRYESVQDMDPVQKMFFYDEIGQGESNENEEKGCHLRTNLPNARLVSTKVHKDKDAPSGKATWFTTQFGQFVDHDITLTPVEVVQDCCQLVDDSEDERCLPIDVTNDEFFRSKSITCLPFTRSVPHCEENGGRRNQINGISSFVDGSQIYGSDLETADNIKFFVKFI